MKNPKWISGIEVVGEDVLGYWERQGWSDAAWVKTTAVIDSARGVEPDRVELGGIAFAGARGITSVEVRLDEANWVAATLKPALSNLTEVLWRAALTASPGRHRLTVRATDGMGTLQTDRDVEPFPNWATGYHSRTLTLE